MSPDQFIQAARMMVVNFRESVDTGRLMTGTLAKQHFDDSFRNEGFTDNALQKWPKRANNRRPGDPVLYERAKDTERLAEQNEVVYSGPVISIINRTSYGGYHNYGKGQKVRKFIGLSTQLNIRIKGGLSVGVMEGFRRAIR